MLKIQAIRRIGTVLALAAVIGTIVLTSHPAQAHEDRVVGPYNLHVGWNSEPALLSQLNAVQLTVTTTTDSKGVTGVEKALTVTVSTHGQTSQPMNLSASDETPGLYTATLIPTATGDYQFHFVGTIGTTKIDETFDSAKGLFNPVDPINSLEFPNQVPSNTDLQKEIDDLKAQIATLKGGAPAPAATMAATMIATKAP